MCTWCAWDRKHMIANGSIVPLESRPTLRMDAKALTMAVIHREEYYDTYDHARTLAAGDTDSYHAMQDEPWQQDPRVMP